MLFIYDLLAARFGDNKSTKVAFRIIQIILVTILFSAVVFYSVFKTKQINYILILVCFIAWLICMLLTLKANNANLHAKFPIPSKKELFGGTLTIGQLNYENIFKISFDNGFEVDLEYKNGEYNVTLKNDEWDNVDTFSSSDVSEVNGFVSQLCKKASEMTPPDESYEIVEDFDEEELDKLEGKTYEGRHMLGHDNYEDELINREMYGENVDTEVNVDIKENVVSGENKDSRNNKDSEGNANTIENESGIVNKE